MFRSLLPLFLALATAAVVYTVAEFRRRISMVNPRFPEATMEQAWESLAGSFERHPDRAFLPVEFWPEAVASEVRERLRDTERMLAQSEQPRTALRTAIIDSASTALHLEVISALDEAERPVMLQGYKPGMESVLRDIAAIASLEYAALRHYARLKYDDAVPNDWFHQFLWHARPYVREKVRLARECLIQNNAGAGKLAETYDALLDQLAKEVLAVPPKKRFVPPDLPVV